MTVEHNEGATDGASPRASTRPSRTHRRGNVRPAMAITRARLFERRWARMPTNQWVVSSGPSRRN